MSTSAGDIPPCPDIQRGSPHSAISTLNGRTPAWAPSFNRGSTRHCLHPIVLQDYWTRLATYLLWSYLSRILSEFSERGLMRDEQFGVRPKYGTSLYLARLFKIMTRNVGKKRLTATHVLSSCWSCPLFSTVPRIGGVLGGELLVRQGASLQISSTIPPFITRLIL